MKHTTLKIGMGSGTVRFPAAMFPTEGFCGVHDAPKIRIMLLKDGISFALVSCEMVMLPDDLIRKIQEQLETLAGVAAENVWVHMTHAISTPHLPGEVPFPPSDDSAEVIAAKQSAYCKAILDASADAVKAAVFSLREGTLRVGRGICDVNRNRDEETPFGWWIGPGSDGDSNKTMTVLRAEGIDGTLLGLLVSCGLKPSVLDNAGIMTGTRQISSDVTGYACAKLEQHFGVPVLFCMSAAGDQIPKDTALYEKVNTEGRPEYVDLGVAFGLQKVEELGTEMAREALVIAENCVSAGDDMAITKIEGSFGWPGKARCRMRPAKTPDYQTDGERKVDISALCVGDLAFVAVKPEINTATERQLWDVSPFETTLLISLVNGGMKYMPEQAAYDRNTWEAQSSMLMPGAAEEFVRVSAQLLEELKERSI